MLLFAEAPDDEEDCQDSRKSQSEPRAQRDLRHGGRQERTVQSCNRDGGEDHDVPGEKPDDKCDQSDHTCVEEGDHDNADAICVAEGGGVVIDCGDNNSTCHEQPVCEWDVELVVENLRGVDNPDRREIAELGDLGDQLERRCDDRLRRNNSSEDRENHSRDQGAFRCCVEHRVRVCLGVYGNVCGLTTVCQQ